MTITASMVRELRERTGAAMMACKKALEAAGGDLEGAIDHLRKHGLKSAAKKADRQTAEGRVIAAIRGDGRLGHLVAVACETDFLSKGGPFRAVCAEIEGIVVAQDPDGLEDGQRPLLSRSRPAGGGTVADLLEEAVGKLGENIRVVDFARLESPEGLVGGYVHHDGKQAALAAIATSADPDRASDILKGLGMHIVFNTPAHLTRDEVSRDVIARERAVILEGDDMEKKPEAIREKIVSGRMEKFFAASVLVEQPWIHEEKRTVAQALVEALGEGTRVEGFARMKIG